MDYRYGYKNKKEEAGTGKKISLFLLGIVIAFIPLIVRASEHSTNLTQFPWFGGGDESLDVFLIVKGQALTIVAVLMLFALDVCGIWICRAYNDFNSCIQVQKLWISRNV